MHGRSRDNRITVNRGLRDAAPIFVTKSVTILLHLRFTALQCNKRK